MSVPLDSGFTLGHYRILEYLGRGVAGETYAVEETSSGQHYALKILHEEIRNNPGEFQKLAKAVREWMQLSHPNILGVYKMEIVEERHGIRMQLADGFPPLGTSSERAAHLEAYINHVALTQPLRTAEETKRARLPVESVLVIIRQILAGLQYAHEKGVLHRALKPHNILLCRDPERPDQPLVKLSDFGLWKAVSKEVIQSKIRLTMTRNQAAVRTAPGKHSGKLADRQDFALLETYDYMSAEQKDGAEPTVAGDLYAVGMITYRMLTGRKVLGLKQISELVPGLSPEWDRWIASATDLDLRVRFKSASEMLSALPTSTYAPIKTKRIQGVPIIAKQKPAFPPLLWAWAGGGGLLLLLAGVFFLWPRSSSEEPIPASVPAPLAAPRQAAEERETATGMKTWDAPLPVSESKEPAKPSPSPAASALDTTLGPKAAPTLPSHVAGGISVRTYPRGATAVLDGYPEQQTPFSLASIPPGKYRLHIYLPGYEAYSQEIEIKDSLLELPEIVLSPLTGRLWIQSKPEGVVWSIRTGPDSHLNYPRAGITPAILSAIPYGRYEIVFERPGWPSQTVEATVTANGNSTAETIFMAGGVRLESVPSGAAILGEDGTILGSTPLTLPDLPPGEYHYKLRARGFQEEAVTVTVSPGSIYKQTCELREAAGPKAGSAFLLELGDGQAMEFLWISGLQKWVGTYEVTNGQYRCMDPDHVIPPLEGYPLDGDRQPVVMVSYEDAETFCRWLNKRPGLVDSLVIARLPSAAEWEHYSGCQDGRLYPWGDVEKPQAGNYADLAARQALHLIDARDDYDDGQVVTAPVELSGRNHLGLFGVGGNVAEWTTESLGANKVLRGGSWGSGHPSALRCSAKSYFPVSFRYHQFGFRVILSPS